MVSSICRCKDSRQTFLLYNPVGIAVDYQTDNIYVANQNTDRVYVFNSEAELLFEFDINANCYSYLPASISTHDMLVYVKTNSFDELLVFDLSGNFISKIKTGTSTLDGFAIDQACGDIYVCNMMGGEINVLLNDPPFTYQFANGFLGHHCLDIKLTKDYVYVLSNNAPYLYLFYYNGKQIESEIPQFELSQSNLPFGMALDGCW